MGVFQSCVGFVVGGSECWEMWESMEWNERDGG
jgi:hypothetical protein